MRADKWGEAARVAGGVCSNGTLAFMFIAGPELSLSAMTQSCHESLHTNIGKLKTAKSRFLSINRSCFASRPNQARLYGVLVKQLR